MDSVQFQHALKLGLGRAILFAQSHDASPFRDLILDACLRCPAYDPQIEGTRSAYMRDLVRCLPDSDFYFDAVLAALPDSDDGWDAAHRFRIAAYMAFDGDERARNAMYASYCPGPEMGEHIGIDFLELDGISGLLFVAEKLGALLEVTPGAVNGGYLLSQSFDLCGEQETRHALREAGAANTRIEAFRLAAEGSEQRCQHSTPRMDVSTLSYDELLATVPPNTPYLLTQWGQEADAADVARAAEGLLSASDPQQQATHLRIFQRQPFPLHPQLLAALLDSEDERVCCLAARALTKISHPAVRDLAFRSVSTDAPGRSEAISMLGQNFASGDHEVALSWFEAEQDTDTLLWYQHGLKDFWQKHPNKQLEPQMLCAIYERGPCSHCRKWAVERLLELGALPDDMRAECAFDSNDEIRKLVGSA